MPGESEIRLEGMDVEEDEFFILYLWFVTSYGFVNCLTMKLVGCHP
jgi:hypothetical protein